MITLLGYDGKSSGEVASNVAGSKLVMMGLITYKKAA